MDVRRREIAQTGVQEGPGSSPSFLSGRERALSDEMAPCRSQVMAARTVRDVGTVSAGRHWARLSTFAKV